MGTNAGAFNATLLVSALVQGGPDLAQRKLAGWQYVHLRNAAQLRPSGPHPTVADS